VGLGPSQEEGPPLRDGDPAATKHDPYQGAEKTGALRSGDDRGRSGCRAASWWPASFGRLTAEIHGRLLDVEILHQEVGAVRKRVKRSA